MDVELYKKLANTPAQLPEVYEKAKLALITCTQLDECKQWADKMAALASYAKQADDDQLETLAKKVRAIALKRCGELLKEFDGRGGDHTSEKSKTIPTYGFAMTEKEMFEQAKITQRQAAADAGMSEHQQLQAVRVANVPDDLFSSLVESNAPPTITELAEIGKKSNGQQSTKNNLAAVYLMSRLRELYEDHIKKNDPGFIIGVMDTWHKEEAKSIVPEIQLWLTEFMEII